MTLTDVPSQFAAPAVTVLARGEWPPATGGEPPTPGGEPPPVPGFIVSSFSPLVIAAAERCLRQRYGEPAGGPVATGIVIVSGQGDLGTAVAVARAVDTGARVSPLLFYQSVPNSAAGYVAARWRLEGPVVCISPAGDAIREGLTAAGLLLDDGEADEVLVVTTEAGTAGATEAGTAGATEAGAATALLVRAAARPRTTTDDGFKEGTR